MRLNKVLFAITTALTLSGGFLLTGCDSNQTPATQGKLSSVNVTVFKTQPLNYELKQSLPARVNAYQVAEIRPQVSGIILKQEFKESSNVKAGQSLYQIDPAIYQASYDSALANLSSVKASANVAHLTLKRYQGLIKTKSISQQDYDKALAETKQADAAVSVAEASANTAKVNLDYTKVYSPIDGYIGKSSVTEGALVSSGQSTAMAIVQKLDPIFIDMTQSATVYEKNQKDLGTIYTPSNKVEIFYSDGTKYENDGVLKFTDRSVNETTGTVSLRAEFPNPDSKILPGMFIKPIWTIGYINNAILVPQRSVTIEPTGEYSAIVAVPISKDKELDMLTNSILTITPNMTEEQIQKTKDNAQLIAKSAIEKMEKSDKEDKTFYYLEKRNNIKVYSAITGYWVVYNGINADEKVITSGTIDLAGKNLNNSQKPVIANIVNDTVETLSQTQLNQIINSNIK